MRRPLLGLAWMALAMMACGKNPLLQMATSNYAPLRVGETWTYATPSGPVTRKIVATLNYFGRDAFQLNTYSSGLTQTSYLADDGAALDIYDTTLGWTLSRRLPYVVGNRWDLASSVPNQSDKIYVDGQETVVAPAGTYTGCFKLRQDTSLYSPGTGLTATSTTSYTWAAAGVGDVQFASVDLSGTVTVTAQLSSYSPGP